MIQIASFLSIGLSVERVPCFTALRVRVSTECCHAYASDVFSEKFREHVFLRGLFLRLILLNRVNMATSLSSEVESLTAQHAVSFFVSFNRVQMLHRQSDVIQAGQETLTTELIDFKRR